MEEIINNIMQSPENTNPNVLRGQLQSVGSGSGGGVFVVGGTVSGTTVTLDKTAGEIYTAMNSKCVLIALENVAEGLDGYKSVLYCAMLATVNGNNYYTFYGQGITTTAEKSDGYPKFGLS